MHRHDCCRAGGELDLRHRRERASRAFPEVLVERIVEQRRAVGTQRDDAARAFGVKAVSQERDDDLHVCEIAHPVRVCRAVTGKRDRGKHGVDGRDFELVADRSGQIGPEEVIGIDRLRRTGEAVHPFGHERCRYHGRMQEGALANDTVRIGDMAPEKQRRRSDRTAGRDEGLGTHRDTTRGGIGAARVETDARERADPVVGMLERKCARARQQRCTALERGGDRRYQHRLLGVGRATHAAIADVPAALDVATDRADADPQCLRAATQRVVVLVRRDRPRRDVETPLSAIEPGREIVGAEPDEAECAHPMLERGDRGAEARRPVDRRAAADAATLQNVDRVVLRLATGRLLVELRIRFGLAHAKVGRAGERSLLDHDDRQAGLGQDLGGGAATGPRADDRDVGLELAILGEGRGVEHLPSCARGRAERILQRRPPQNIGHYWNRAEGAHEVPLSQRGEGIGVEAELC